MLQSALNLSILQIYELHRNNTLPYYRIIAIITTIFLYLFTFLKLF